MTGRVQDVERLLQVLSVLRASEGYPVPRAALARRVTAYARSTADPESLKKMMDRDLDAMAGQGFRIDNVAAAGDEAAYVLREGEWRLPIELEPAERSMLVWAMAAAGSVGREAAALASLPSDLSSLLGTTPPGLDLVQAALAGGRSLVIERNGEEQVFAPGRLANRRGRWFVLGRFHGESQVKAPRLDRLGVLRLGEVLPERVDVTDEDGVLDPANWHYHEQRETELRCAAADLGAVSSWFPRAQVLDLGDDEVSLRFSYRNEDALVDRVIGLAGAARIVSPASAVLALRQRVAGVLA